MSISLNGGYVIADARFAGLCGEPAADGYRFKVTIVFATSGWKADSLMPVVRLSPASVTVRAGEAETNVGYAYPESTIPFTVSSHGTSTGHLHIVTLTPVAMEVIDRLRSGQGITLRLKLMGEVWHGNAATPIQETVECRVSQSDWLAALEQSGFGRTLLFEVPLPATEDSNAPAPARYLQQAQRLFVQGHYDEAVAICRKALEAAMATGNDQVDAMKSFRGGKDKDLNLGQRELVIRQSVMNYLHPAHHHGDDEEVLRYDRSSAAMALGLTASLLCRSIG